ncbi:MAG TPA: antitoxin family protein [Tepidisphaeraceae bacterium]|nr:antitoxin family protein [Tepidisphaeraceae bacterium]
MTTVNAIYKNGRFEPTEPVELPEDCRVRLSVEPVGTAGQGKPVFGAGRGSLTVVSGDDEHLKDFEKYMK